MEHNNQLPKRLKSLRVEKDLLQLDVAKYLGITKSAYGFYEQGKRKPDFNTVSRLADFYGVTADYILGRSNDICANEAYSSSLVPVPILGRIKAGPNGYLDEIPMGYIPTEKRLLNSSPHFWLEVSGDSMTGFCINDGDFVLIRKEYEKNNGKIYAVMVDDCEVTLKAVQFLSDGILLVAGNPNYPPRFFSANDIDNGHVAILGSAKEIRRVIQ